ncbi:MAG: hypothetical protein ACMUIE_10810 [Thermoplasmatota archaeon]
MKLFSRKQRRMGKEIDEIRKEVKKREKRKEKEKKRSRKKYEMVDTVVDVLGERYPTIEVSADLVEGILDRLDLDDDLDDDDATLTEKVKDAVEDLTDLLDPSKKKKKKKGTKSKTKNETQVVVEDELKVKTSKKSKKKTVEKEVKVEDDLVGKYDPLSMSNKERTGVEEPNYDFSWRRQSKDSVKGESKRLRKELGIGGSPGSISSMEDDDEAAEYVKKIGKLIGKGRGLDEVIDAVEDYIYDVKGGYKNLDVEEVFEEIGESVYIEIRNEIKRAKGFFDKDHYEMLMEDYQREIEFLQLNQNMQMENRTFTLVSNIMKVRHDRKMGAINNVR